MEEQRQQLQAFMARQINDLYAYKMEYASLVLPSVFDKKPISEFQMRYRRKKAEAIQKLIDGTCVNFPEELSYLTASMCQHEEDGKEIFGDVLGKPIDYFVEFKDEVDDFYKNLEVLKNFYVEAYEYLQGFQIDFANYRSDMIHRLGLEKAMQKWEMKTKRPEDIKPAIRPKKP